jgi:hypothetical protein
MGWGVTMGKLVDIKESKLIMEKCFHQRTLILILGLSIINGVSVIAHSLLATISGVLVALVEIQVLGNYEIKWRVLNLIIATLLNTATTYIILYIYCASFANNLCERNLLILSVLPGFILTLYLFLSLVASLTKMILK